MQCNQENLLTVVTRESKEIHEEEANTPVNQKKQTAINYLPLQ